MKLKRIIAVLLAVLMCIMALVSCSGDKDQPSDSSGDTENGGENSATGTEDDKVLTKFEIQFSKENEKLLSEILEGKIESADPEKQLPTVSKEADARVRAGDNGWTYVYEKAKKDFYDEYCDALIKTGVFAQYTETEFNGKLSKEVHNYFTTFVSSSAQIDIGLHDAASRMYVTVTHRSKSVLPQREAPEYTPAGKEYPTLWTQFGLEDIDNRESSLGYIIRLADGTFIIMDSGEPYEGVEERIYDILKVQAPDPQNIVVSAWIITHGHSDHVGGFIRFAERYGADKTINVKQMVYNFPDSSNISTVDGSVQNSVRAAIKEFHSTPEILKPHAGNVLYYADVKINILYTQEEHLAVEEYFGNYNCTSIVTQFVMADGTKLLIGADHPVDGVYEGYTWCEGALWRWYGNFIESNVVSTFHHGYGGGADSVIYSAIKPQIVLWDVDQYRVDFNKLKETSTNRYFTSASAASKGIKYYIAGDDMIILTFSDGKVNVTRYDTYADYKAGNIAVDTEAN
jgi:beta-lactamase superfamily II metal-dependent hydrolase